MSRQPWIQYPSPETEADAARVTVGNLRKAFGMRPAAEGIRLGLLESFVWVSRTGEVTVICPMNRAERRQQRTVPMVPISVAAFKKALEEVA